jgi:hypothetical protein
VQQLQTEVYGALRQGIQILRLAGPLVARIRVTAHALAVPAIATVLIQGVVV